VVNLNPSITSGAYSWLSPVHMFVDWIESTGLLLALFTFSSCPYISRHTSGHVFTQSVFPRRQSSTGFVAVIFRIFVFFNICVLHRAATHLVIFVAAQFPKVVALCAHHFVSNYLPILLPSGRCWVCSVFCSSWRHQGVVCLNDEFFDDVLFCNSRAAV